jgi:putative transposase
MIGQDDAQGLRVQLSLLGLSNQAWYYQPAPETPLNLLLMRLIDGQYLRKPYYGVPRMTHYLNGLGHGVNPKRVSRLYRLMGIEAVRPRPRTTIPAEGHKVYPYLLRGLEITRPNQVFTSDLTYIPMERGFLYLVAVMDWYSRYVLSWELCNSMDAGFCVEAQRRALEVALPEIFNTDQGVQFTSEAFTQGLLERKVAISMDGRGRWMDNVMMERLWRTVKYEYVYLHSHTDGMQLWKGLNDYFHAYNHENPHSSLGMATPADVYYGRARLSTK